jgi:hypothetical protein
MAKLKVFRTPIGFHDAYVAAPSRKAALSAWGAEKDLFARGAAEEVTDPALTAAPLATPGVVVKVSRGGREAQLAALPKPAAKRSAARSDTKTKPKRTPKPPTPKPSRTALDRAERALADAEARYGEEEAAIAREFAALERRKRDLKKRREAELTRLTDDRASADAKYRDALAAWRENG